MLRIPRTYLDSDVVIYYINAIDYLFHYTIIRVRKSKQMRQVYKSICVLQN